MAKKSRRARRQQRVTRAPARPSPAAAAPPRAQPSAEPASERDALVAPPARKQVDFSAEYRYVVSDLRSMAIIALAMLVVLVALSFVIS